MPTMVLSVPPYWQTMGQTSLKLSHPRVTNAVHGDPWTKKAAKADSLNRNKKGVTLNLKNEKAREIFYDMVREADVVVENFRVGVSKKLKVDYETLREINPKIIYASGSGFGQYGPLSDRPCYDIVAQSMGGMVPATISWHSPWAAW